MYLLTLGICILFAVFCIYWSKAKQRDPSGSSQPPANHGNLCTVICMKTSIGGWVVGLTFMLAIVIGSSLFWKDLHQSTTIINAFKVHHGLHSNTAVPCFIERDELEDVKSLISDVTKSFPIIVGPHGTGKSTALIKAVEEVAKTSPGIVYIEVPFKCERFINDLASLFEIDLRNPLLWTPDLSPLDLLMRRLLSVPLMFARNLYRTPSSLDSMEFQVSVILSFILHTVKHSDSNVFTSAPTLVFDNIGHLLNCDNVGLQTLFSLQDFAKAAVDKGILRVVFGSSEVNVINKLMQRSSSSRLALLTSPVGDISLEQAKEYLYCLVPHFREKNQNITSIYNVLGGRFSLLVKVEAYFREYGSGYDFDNNLEIMIESLHASIIRELSHIGITPFPIVSDSNYSNSAWRVAKYILESQNGKISYEDFFGLTGNLTSVERDKLLGANVFLVKVPSKQISFQSVPIELYFKKRLLDKNH